MNRQRAIKQLKFLRKLISKQKLRLAAEWREKWKILISTILSSQTKDETTIKISNKLYRKYKSAKQLSEAPLNDIKKIIKLINFYKTKAKHIKQTSKIISGDGIPSTREELLKLPGVGRKVANVYLAVAHNMPCIGVDTHVSRISQKLGWTKNANREKIEKDLEELFPKKFWVDINYILVRFGRIYGISRKREEEILKRVKNIK